MKKRLIIGTAIPAVIVLTFGIMTWANYNALVKADQNVKLEQAGILTALVSRNSLITQLVTAADAYLDHESNVYLMITDARSDYADAMASGLYDDLVLSDAMTSLALTSLIAVVEDTPEMQADSVIIGLMGTMETQEYTLKNARESYNAAAIEYNTDINLFPRIIFAKMFGYYAEKPLWMQTTGEDIVVEFPE